MLIAVILQQMMIAVDKILIQVIHVAENLYMLIAAPLKLMKIAVDNSQMKVMIAVEI